MSAAYLWAIILGGLVVTYLTRTSFILLIPLEQFPNLFRRGLSFVPPAVLTALIPLSSSALEVYGISHGEMSDCWPGSWRSWSPGGRKIPG